MIECLISTVFTIKWFNRKIDNKYTNRSTLSWDFDLILIKFQEQTKRKADLFISIDFLYYFSIILHIIKSRILILKSKLSLIEKR